MTVKPRTDEERRTWLRLCRLTGERDKLEHEQSQLRRQVLGAIVSGPDWPGPPLRELNGRLRAASSAWAALVDEIRRAHDGDRPPMVIPQSPPTVGGVLQVGVLAMRVKR
jgi:hypothetical protein